VYHKSPFENDSPSYDHMGFSSPKSSVPTI
jgi:hypothetical protein